MTISYTEEMALALLDNGAGNSGAVINGMLTDIDAGRSLIFVAGEAIAQYDAIALAPSDGKIYKAYTPTRQPCIGIAPYAIASGQSGLVRIFGWMDITDASLSATRGDLLYLDVTAGKLTDTEPNINAFRVGMAKTTTDGSNITRVIINPLFEKKEGLEDIVVHNGNVICTDTQVVFLT